ncbi:hypothetical protein Rhe02_69740 [Rhizocola hellebori]|uniref:AAA+ ATPase domain-containing protein n=1 Tax=Rhizocola hellebori TaxID=1392758 RepID=A0A8J3VJW3_9ACTN|nr:ATP-binding protein [Rhizocola hellebori]GIH08907.1 hypothetical protein Rhe02_69740 [Rhizocola hellebori]
MSAEFPVPQPYRAQTQREFVALLRQLKECSGLTYRQMEIRAERLGFRLARSTVASVLSRNTLPRQELVQAIVHACGQDPLPWLQARRRLSAAGHKPDAESSDAPAQPRQLPTQISDPIGRERELMYLTTLLLECRRSGGVPIVSGPPGSGKSMLAVAAARKAVSHFPDGQLYVDLKGSTPGALPLSPIDIAGRLLSGMGVDGAQVPATVDEAAALLRTVTTGRRVLVLLDGAVAAAQVRCLVPLGPGAVVFVTSRAGLTSLDGSHHLSLTNLSPIQAVALMEQLLGIDRVRAEPAAVRRLAKMCGYLPLALRVAAARLTVRRDLPVGAFVERLADQRQRLDELRIDDLDVRASLEISYRQLIIGDQPDRCALRAFLLIGASPQPELEVAKAATLLEMSTAEVDRAMERLVDAGLVESIGPGRYRMNNLVWLLAQEHARAEQSVSTPGPAAKLP